MASKIDNANDKSLNAEPTISKQIAPQKSQAYSSLRYKFAAVVVAQILMLATFAAPKAYTLNTGKVITLHTVPVDPFDWFRGEYVSLSYKEITEITSATKFQQGQEIFVIIDPNLKISAVSAKAPALKNNQISLKGRVKYFYESENRQNKITVDYGIERLYMPEGRSRELEQNVKELAVDVAVANDGTPVIKHVKLKDKLVYDGMNMLDPFSH